MNVRLPRGLLNSIRCSVSKCGAAETLFVFMQWPKWLFLTLYFVSLSLSLSRLSSDIIKYDTANESYQTTILSSSLTKMYFLLLVKSRLYIMLLSKSIIALFYLLCMCITNTNKTYPLLIYNVNEVSASVKNEDWMNEKVWPMWLLWNVIVM